MMEDKNDSVAPTVLVVEDQDYTLEMIEIFLKPSGYVIHTAMDGLQAWNKLIAAPELYMTVLLDRLMPPAGEFSGGLDVLRKMKTHPVLKKIPVIIQTGLKEEEHIIQGLDAGAYYYLAKPYKRNILQAIVNAAVNDFKKGQYLAKLAKEIVDALAFIKQGHFEFRTLEEGQKLATLMGSLCPGENDVVVGLWELIVNAVEHGNLGISYEEKSVLNEKDQWENEVRRRLALPEYQSRKVRFEVKQINDEIHFIIEDEGEGFDWQTYMEFTPERLFDNHGRGIAMANKFSFHSLEYHGNGNRVTGIVKK